MARSMSAWSACGLIRMSTGLPMAYTPTNTSSDMKYSTSTLCIRRRMMNTGMEKLSARNEERKMPGKGGGIRIHAYAGGPPLFDRRSLRPDVVGEGVLVGARAVNDAFFHRP